MNRLAVFVALLATSLLAPTVATAQAGEPPALLSSGESHERVWFVPRLAGSLAIDASLLQSFAIGRRATIHPTTSAGISIGWRHFFDGHGRLSLRTFAAYDRGGIFDGGIDGSSNRIGGGLALTARGINQNWVFGALSIVVDGAAVIVEPPPRALLGLASERETGFQVGAGIEAMFGSLIVLDPYLFVETGASLALSYLELPSSGGWELWGRWIFRFDVGVRGKN